MAAGEFKLRGFKTPNPAEAGLKSARVRVRAEFRVGASRGPEDATAEEAVADRDVVELEFRDGLRLWMRGDEYRARAVVEAKRSGAALTPGVYEVPTRWQAADDGGAERGFGGLVLKALRVLGVDPAGATARTIAEGFEKGRKGDPKRPGPGFYRVQLQTGGFGLEPAKREDVPTDKPVLVLIHGTASSTWGSFGDLWSAARRDTLARLREHYRGNVFAFEHRSFTESVIKNALDLANCLPGKARVDLLSHSRGGLVGELLCRGSVTDGEPPFEAAEIERAGELRGLDDRSLTASEREKINESLERAKKDLNELGKILAGEGRFVVERFVRVACPALGTTLVSNRLDRWLSMIANVGGLALPASPIADIAESLGDFIAAVIDEKTDPTTLPGLAFFLPDAGLIRVVNNLRRSVNSRLCVIAGDIAPEGIWQRLLNLVLDRFYEGEHDLVVNTVSMRGGTPRTPGNGLLSYHQGPTVNHFTYFNNAASAEAIATALTLPPSVRLPGFEDLRPPEKDIPRGPALRAPQKPAPYVFVLPGIMGSELKIGEREIWVKVVELADGGLADLRIDAANVEAWQPYPGYYRDLIDFLGHTHKVIPFPFDWRLAPEQEADRLAKALDKAIDEANAEGQPVRLLAHSMGGLIARAMIAKRSEVWKKLVDSHPAARFVMLGTPNGGSHSITELIVGKSETFRGLALLDFKNTTRELLETIVKFPGVLAMLPNHGREDWFDPATWERYSRATPSGWAPPAPEDLVAAKQFRELLKASPIDPARMIYVAGKARATIADMLIGVSDMGGNEVQFEATRRGDGRVTWDSGIPKDLRPYYMPVGHGDLSAAVEHFPAIVELLETGATGKLTQAAPVERAEDRTFLLRRAPEQSIPDERSLAAAMLGATPAVRRKRKVQQIPLQVSILHGDLAHSPHPILVGHYAGDTIVSAERELDRALGGRLNALHRVGLYPGPLETCQLVLRVGDGAHGAVIVGLGPAGELNTGQLKRTVAHAALSYAMEAVDQATAPAQGAAREIALASLLIGTQAGGVRVVDSVFAIVDGVVRANEALEAAEQQVRIARVVLLELYEDRALAAIDALRSLADESTLRGRFVYEPRITPGRGRRTRLQFEEPPGWWQRLQVRGLRPDGRPDTALTFLALTRRARAEARAVEGQRRLVDALVSRAISSADYDRGLGQTLFDLLVPNALKEQAPDEDRLMLVLDAESARYPWELLEDPLESGGRPLAIGRGMIRQLETKGFRANVRGGAKNIALVVGDPLLTDQGRKKFPRLDGAKAEATAVARQLAQSGFDVEERIRAASGEITQALYAWPYRILHIAAHGVYREPLDTEAAECDRCGRALPVDAGAKKTATGVVIGDDVYLTPGEIEQMRRVPEVVFVNCCHLGFVEDTPVNAIAANVATQFIAMGVHCVVAAGWAVNDKAAETFATTFYAALLNGAAFGDAVTTARLETWENHRDTNTWGAYQCYGDPDYRLWVSEGPARRWQFATAQQVVGEIEGIVAALGRRASGEGVQDLVDRLDRIETEAEPFGGTSNGAIATALARAYGEAKRFERSIELYRATLASESAEMRLRDIEQLANFESRWAAREFKDASKEKRDELRKVNDASIRRLRWLAGASEDLDAEPEAAPGATAERLALIAGAYKRKADMSPGDAKRKAEELSRKWYRTAAEIAQRNFASALSKGKSVRPDAYPLTAWAGAELLGAWEGPVHALSRSMREQLDRSLKEAAQVLRDCTAPVETVWDSVHPVDIDLLLALLEDALTDEVVEALAKRYAAIRANASPREFDSVIDQIGRFAAAAGAKKPARRGAPDLAAQLGKLVEKLSAAEG